MANMSYCRFHNTRMDMDDCLEALADGEELSRGEAADCIRMFEAITEYLYDEGLLDGFDEDAFQEWKREILGRAE